MVKPTPDPPDIPPATHTTADRPAFEPLRRSAYAMTDSFTTHHAFGPCVGDLPILAVRDGMPVAEVLTQACEYMKGVSAGAAELVENCPPHLRALARHVEHASEIARALVEASVAGLARPGMESA